ncbi:MAG: hypothetical protein Q8O31_06990, partial [Rhodocyclaceae bacterium]|nr:hypothetical protein [Rhodocyclaceae bacterium]
KTHLQGEGVRTPPPSRGRLGGGWGIGVALTLLPVLAQAEITLSGFLQQNTAFNTVTKNPDGRHHKWLEERARLQLDASQGEWRFFAKGDIATDHLGRHEGSELREGYIDTTAGHWDLRIGRQIITWGLGDLVFVNDIWAKDHEAMFAGRPMEYLKRGVDAVTLGVYPEFASFDLIVAPEFRTSRTPDANRFHNYDPMPSVTNRETVKPSHGEWGLRAYRDIAGWDTAIYLYQGFQRTPSMRPDDMNNTSKITYSYPKLSTYGVSASGRLGDGVLSVEAAFYDSPSDRSGNDFAVPNAQTRWLIGYQIQPWEDTSLGFQTTAEHMHDYAAYLAAQPAGFPIDKRTSQTITARLTQSWLHQTLRFSVYASYRPHDSDSFINPELRYSFTDKVWGSIGANLFNGRASGSFGQFSRDDNFYMQMRYEF